MNDRNFDQLLNAWMDLGPTTAPDRVADAARLEAAATRQLPAALSRWAPRRFPVMNTVRSGSDTDPRPNARGRRWQASAGRVPNYGLRPIPHHHHRPERVGE